MANKIRLNETVKERTVFDHENIKIIRRDTQMNSGRERHYIWDRRSQKFVVVVAETIGKRYLFVREFKHGVTKMIVGLVAGGVDAGESPEQAALRELEEETGYTCENLTLLRSGIVDFPNKIAGGEHFFFLATGAKPLALARPEAEIILLGKDDLIPFICGTHPQMKLDTAMSIACLSVGLLSNLYP